MIPSLWQGDNLVMLIGTKQHIINKNTHPNFNLVVEAIRNKDWDAIPDLVDISARLASYADGKIKVDGDVVTFDGIPLDNRLSNAFIKVLQDRLPVDHLVAFVNNLMENPSYRSVNSLYDFLEKNDMPITEDGCFMAYKAVDDDYMSKHNCEITGERVRYAVGDKPSMLRNQISDDPNVLCHRGLHACSFEYLKGWSGKHLMLVKINPKDVVCVPNDCNQTKMRVCYMEVVSEVLDENGNPWYSQFTPDYNVLNQDEVNFDEDEIERIRREAYEVGRREGYEEGREAGYSDGYDVGSDSVDESN